MIRNVNVVIGEPIVCSHCRRPFAKRDAELQISSSIIGRVRLEQSISLRHTCGNQMAVTLDPSAATVHVRSWRHGASA